MRKPAFCTCENKDADQLRGNREADQCLCFRYTDCTIPLPPNSEIFGGALALWLERWTPDRETRVRSSAGSVCCFLEQETFTPQKYWLYPGIGGSVSLD